MNRTHGDGSAGDADYTKAGLQYANFRQPDAHIAQFITSALGDAATVLNIGAGAGSYEPTDRVVTAVEPSASMRSARPAHLSKAIDAIAEDLPLPDQHFDASMAIFTIHQWRDRSAGLSEMRRVTKGPALIVTCDPRAMQGWWLDEYAPEVIACEAARMPSVEQIAASLGGDSSIVSIPIPLQCTDGFTEAYYGRPERLLDRNALLACSSWGLVDDAVIERFVQTLSGHLADKTWDERYGSLRSKPFFDGSLRLIVGSA